MSEKIIHVHTDKSVVVRVLGASEFKQAILEHHSDIADVERFWAKKKDEIVRYCETNLEPLMDCTLGYLMKAAIDAALERNAGR